MKKITKKRERKQDRLENKIIHLSIGAQPKENVGYNELISALADYNTDKGKTGLIKQEG